MAQQTSELYSVVLQKIIDEVPDGLARETAFLDWLSKDGLKSQKGGLYIQFPIKLVANSASGFISGTNAVVNTTPSIQLQYGVLNWKYYNFNVNFTLADYNIASGEEEIVDFMESKITGGLEDAMREISTAIQGTSTTNALAVEGLKDITAATGTAYGSLTDTDYATGAYLPVTTTDTTVNYANINSMITKLQARMRNMKKAKRIMGLMNPATYARYKTSVQNQQLFIDQTIASSGFEGFKVNNVEFYMDADVAGTQDGSTGDSTVYIFPVDIMKLYHNFGFGNKSPFDGEVQLPNSPIMSIQHYMTYNLICNNRRLVAYNSSFVS